MLDGKLTDLVESKTFSGNRQLWPNLTRPNAWLGAVAVFGETLCARREGVRLHTRQRDAAGGK